MTIRDEDFHFLVTASDGNQYHVAISILIGDNGQADYALEVAAARTAMLARFPGAIVLNEASDVVVSSYVANGYWWAEHGVTWKYNAAGGPGVAGGFGAISSGADAWSGSGADFAFSYGGTTTGDTGSCNFSPNDEHVVGWVDQPGNVLGVTCILSGGGGSPHPADFDMELDPGWDWTTTTNGVGTDLQSVATHEFGHALGLGHSLVIEAVMYQSYEGGTLKRNLHSDDIAGAIAIYGGTAPEPTDTPTATVTKTPTATPTSEPPTPTPANTRSLVLKAGANLLAWPGQTTLPARAMVGQDAVSVVYEWNPLAKTWNRWAPNVPAFVNTLAALKQGGAYWFLSTTATSISYTD